MQPGSRRCPVWEPPNCISAFADYVVLLASSNHDLQHALEVICSKCEAAGTGVSTFKSEIVDLCRTCLRDYIAQDYVVGELTFHAQEITCHLLETWA